MRRLENLNQDIVYASGFFDGEGNVHLALDKRANPPRVVLMVTITNTRRDVLDWFKENFSGNVFPVNVHPKRGHKRGYNWRLYSRSACMFLKSIYPYVKIKKEQVGIALTLYDTKNRRGKRRSQEEVDRRMKIRELVNSMNA